MVFPSEIFIIGGGYSIKEGLKLDLKEKIKNKCVFALNFAFHHFDSTALISVDEAFYRGFIYGDGFKCSHEHIEAIKALPLHITPKHDFVKAYDNTVTLPRSDVFRRDNPQRKGFFLGIRPLCGIFALSIASYISRYNASIFLLGFDGGQISKESTHYYTEIHHSGIGKTQIYDFKELTKSFESFAKEPKLKIYNVSKKSNIDYFSKISYPEMFQLLTSDTYNQTQLRKNIKEKLQCKD